MVSPNVASYGVPSTASEIQLFHRSILKEFPDGADILDMHSRTFFAIAMGTCTLLATSTFAGEKRQSGKPAPEAVASSGAQLTALVDAAAYSPADKAALLAGLRAAAPFGFSDAAAAHVSQQTIDLQVKKSSSDLQRSIKLIFDVAKCIEQNHGEFLATPEFQSLPASDRSSVSTRLGTISEEYSVRALETLFAANGRTINVPANVTRSPSDPNYQQVLFLTARLLQDSTANWATVAPAKPAQAVPPAEAIAAPAAEAAPAAPVEALVSSAAPAVAAPVAAPEPTVAVTPAATPTPEVPVAPVATPAPVVAAPAAPCETYTLKVGDSFAYVARLKKVSIQALLEANPDVAPAQMRVGQVLTIPSTAAPTAPAVKAEAKSDRNTAMLVPRSTSL